MKRMILVCYCIAVLVACFVPANAQRGAITGRVVTQEGNGLPNVTVILSPVVVDQRSVTGNRFERTVTDEEGNFKFADLAPRSYIVNVSEAKDYVRSIVPFIERQNFAYSNIGDTVTIPMVRGGVITGRVTGPTGEPIIGVRITAIMVRDQEGRPLSQQFGGRSRLTDDRGIYRLYGLVPGT